jgi:polar amino acid transport system substrate-binding protein
MLALRLQQLLILLLVCVSQMVRADDFMVFGAYDGFPKYFEVEGQAKGIVVDITRYCLDDMQVPHQIRLMPWMRAYTRALRGDGGVIGLSISADRQALFDFSDPIFTERIVLLVKQGQEFPYKTIADLRGKLVGVSTGSSYGTAFEQAVSDGTLTLVGFNDIRNGLAMLMRGRIDAVLMGSSMDIHKLIREEPDLQGAQFTTLPEPFKTDSKYLGIAAPLKMRGFLQRFNQCLRQGYATGRFDSIIYSYSN